MRKVIFPKPITELKISVYLNQDNQKEVIVRIATKDQVISWSLDEYAMQKTVETDA